MDSGRAFPASGLQGIESLGNDLMFDLLLIAARPLGRSCSSTLLADPKEPQTQTMERSSRARRQVGTEDSRLL